MPAFAGMTSFRGKPESGVSAKQIEEPIFLFICDKMFDIHRIRVQCTVQPVTVAAISDKEGP